MTWQTVRERILPFVPLLALAVGVAGWGVSREVWAATITDRVTANEANIIELKADIKDDLRDIKGQLRDIQNFLLEHVR